MDTKDVPNGWSQPYIWTINGAKWRQTTSQFSSSVFAGIIKSIRTVPSGVEIEVVSDKEFPVRNEIAVLRIGSKEFTLSRYLESGDTHTMIFTLTPEEFAKTTTGDLAIVQYGRGDESNQQWNFGPLDKSLLDKKR